MKFKNVINMKEVKELIEYIDFQEICEDFDLKFGDLSLDQECKLESILQEFINQNKQKLTKQTRRVIDNINVIKE